MSEGQRWWLVRKLATMPEPVVVYEFTDKTVVVDHHGGKRKRAMRESEWFSYHPTEAEALRFLMAHTDAELATLEAQVARLRRGLKNQKARLKSITLKQVEMEL